MQVVTFAQQKGGVGKSTLIINTAAAATLGGHKVAIIDMDPQGSVIRWATARNSAAEFPIVVTANMRNIDDTLKRLEADDFEWVFLDLPGKHGGQVNAGMEKADFVLVPTRPSQIDLGPSMETVIAAQQLGRPYAFVVSIAPTGRRRADDVEQLRQALTEAGHQVAPPAIWQRVAYSDAYDEGQSVFDRGAKSDASKEINNLWTWLEGASK